MHVAIQLTKTDIDPNEDISLPAAAAFPRLTNVFDPIGEEQDLIQLASDEAFYQLPLSYIRELIKYLECDGGTHLDLVHTIAYLTKQNKNGC